MNHNCDAFATCHNDHGVYTCECNKGYVGNGIFCDDIDECITDDHNCPLKTVCKNNDGSFNCDCDVGYKIGDADESCEDGVCVGNCVDIDECVARIDTCHDRTECANTDGRKSSEKCNYTNILTLKDTVAIPKSAKNSPGFNKLTKGHRIRKMWFSVMAQLVRKWKATLDSVIVY